MIRGKVFLVQEMKYSNSRHLEALDFSCNYCAKNLNIFFLHGACAVMSTLRFGTKVLALLTALLNNALSLEANETFCHVLSLALSLS